MSDETQRPSRTESDGDPQFAHKDDQPAGSQVDGYAPKYPEPEGSAVVEPETRSGAGVGSGEWECLTCGHRFTEDHGVCPDDGAPLRTIGSAAGPVAGKTSTGENKQMATNPEQTPEGYGEAGTSSAEPEQGDLQGERGSGV